jgi:D-glycero-alpha-D-manno-heptose-7-phosphate kinase
MIISRTPFRVSFFGGGTDYPAWFEEHGGAALSMAIDRYCYLTCRFLPQFFEYKSRVVWSQIEAVQDHGDIQHPVVREVLKYLDIAHGVEIHHNADLPARTGLGSSSAFTVGLLHALHSLRGEMATKDRLAQEAVFVEQQLLRESVGVQDQIQTAHGGLNRIDIAKDGRFQVHPITLRPERMSEFENHMLLFYTGVARYASEIAAQQIAAIPKKQRELHLMRAQVDQAAGILAGYGDIRDFGRLLHEGWELKRSLSAAIAPTFVNDIYGRAMGAGALGGKLLGAGGGGFMLFFVEPEQHHAVLDALSELLLVPLGLDRDGSKIIFYDPPRYSRTALGGAAFERYEGHPARPDDDAAFERRKKMALVGGRNG